MQTVSTTSQFAKVISARSAQKSRIAVGLAPLSNAIPDPAHNAFPMKTVSPLTTLFALMKVCAFHALLTQIALTMAMDSPVQTESVSNALCRPIAHSQSQSARQGFAKYAQKAQTVSTLVARLNANQEHA